MNTHTTKAARFSAYRAALALERIAAHLAAVAQARPNDDTLAELLDASAGELVHHADALREGHALDAEANANLASITGRNASVRV